MEAKIEAGGEIKIKSFLIVYSLMFGYAGSLLLGAFSRVSTGDPDIPSSCEMKHEPEFKPLQGNMAFF